MSGLSEVIARVSARLVERGIAHRLIGAAALAAHGVARSTRDVDLLVSDPAVLDPELWEGVAPPGFTTSVRHGDAVDPLLGVVRVEEELTEDTSWEDVLDQVDIVVVRGRWASAMTNSPGPMVRIEGTELRAVHAVDLALLKLYAGGPRDAWDIAMLLDAAPDRAALAASVDARLGELPERCARLWRRVQGP